ncbi:MAG: hypothetical protein IJH86_09175 [Clostridia bacterium]|nr:hypothetical protein [Clostridia bacterium]
MTNKHAKYALIALFLALLYLPVPLSAAFIDDRNGQDQENRTLTQRPVLSIDTIGAFPQAYEAYYRDHQPFRAQLIFTRALLSKTLYDRDVSGKVLFGRNGWLYYGDTGDGMPIADYRGEMQFSEQELRKIASDLMKTSSALKDIGCDFVLFIAPNKSRVYSEYMPDRYGAPAESYAALRLVRYLRRHSTIKVVYPYEELMQAKRDFADIDIYYPRDTHWNYVGSYIGTRALMRQLDVELPALTPEMIRKPEAARTGDLSILTHLENRLPKDIDYVVTNPDGSAFTGPMLPEQARKRRVYLYRDSFGEYMEDYLFTCFSREDSAVSVLNVDEALIDELRPDVFILESVERYLRMRLQAGPLYTAPDKRRAKP